MYPVSLEYQNKIKENNRLFEARIQINHSTGVLNLSDEDITLGSLTYTEGSQAGEDFTVGGTVASDLSVGILNKPEYDDIDFIGARITATISLLIREGVDAHFLSPSQPSKMPNTGDELWQDIPLGRFNIDEAPRQRNSIQIKALDDMANLDKPYSLSTLSYPANLYQIYVDICNVADVTVGTIDFPNKNYIVTTKPDGDLSLRDVLGYVAELSGTFAKFNRNGACELRWYKPTGITLGPENRFDFFPSDAEIKIKGVMATVEDTTYLAGTEDYAIDLTDNPLLQSNHETVLPAIYNNVKDAIFTPYTSDWQGNMAIEAGDMIAQIDRDGKVYDTLITRSIYKYRGRSNLEAKGLPEISKGFKGSTDKRIAQIKRVAEQVIGDKLTSLEQAQLNATEMLANMLGGYIIEDKPNGIIYIADNPNIDLAMKVWKYGINGFGYSSTGVNGTYTTAVTADGSIVAMLVSANIITANMIQTGILQANNGKSFFDLDNGILRISHGGNVYSQGDINGWGKDYGNGVVSYLNDIWINQYGAISSMGSTTEIPYFKVDLPLSFRNRQGKINIMLSVANFNLGISFQGIMNDFIAIQLEKVSENYTANPPYVMVKAQLMEREASSQTRYYYPIQFNLMAIGK